MPLGAANRQHVEKDKGLPRIQDPLIKIKDNGAGEA